MSKTAKIILLLVAIITLIGTIVGISIVKKDRYYDEDIIVQDVSKPETIKFQIENETYKITMPANTEFAIQKPNDTTFVISYAIGGTPIADGHTISFVKELISKKNKDFEFNEKLASVVAIIKIEASEFTAKHRPLPTK